MSELAKVTGRFMQDSNASGSLALDRRSFFDAPMRHVMSVLLRRFVFSGLFRKFFDVSEIG